MQNQKTMLLKKRLREISERDWQFSELWEEVWSNTVDELKDNPENYDRSELFVMKFENFPFGAKTHKLAGTSYGDAVDYLTRPDENPITKDYQRPEQPMLDYVKEFDEHKSEFVAYFSEQEEGEKISAQWIDILKEMAQFKLGESQDDSYTPQAILDAYDEERRKISARRDAIRKIVANVAVLMTFADDLPENRDEILQHLQEEKPKLIYKDFQTRADLIVKNEKKFTDDKLSAHFVILLADRKEREIQEEGDIKDEKNLKRELTELEEKVQRRKERLKEVQKRRRLREKKRPREIGQCLSCPKKAVFRELHCDQNQFCSYECQRVHHYYS